MMANKKRLVAITLAILMLVMETLSLFSCGTEIENLELSFNVDGENYATITTTGTETIQIPENPSKDGYTFDGWYWDKDVWSKPFTANSLLDAPISSDMSVYAKFTPIAYSISYEMDGGTHNNPETYTIESDFAFADVQKAGYTFLGWYTDATYTTQIKSISEGTTGDMTLYAKFELATYSITYENTKDAENTNPTTYTINSETITFAPLSKDGYTFGGWYVGDTKVMEISKGSTGNLSLTAKWDLNSYGITYNNVTGATNNNPTTYDVENQPIALTDASKTGYKFLGWYSDENFTNKVTEIAVGTTGPIELWAKWEAIEYTATFMDGTTVVAEIPFTVETEFITAPEVPTHAGYTGVWESYTLGTEDIIVKAIYTVIPYGITYHNVAGATNSNPATYDVEDQPLTLTDASKTGYKFLGWYSDESFTNEVTEIAVGTTGPVELWAKWEIIEYTATFVDGDTPVGTVKFTVETESITEPALPDYTGYTGVWESYTLGHEDITVNAVYTPITYTITYNNTKGVSHSNPTSYTVESATITLSNISANGYEFNGWFDKNNVQVTKIASGNIGNIELYAKWTIIQYEINYMYDQDIGDYIDENKNPEYYTIEDDFDFIALVNKTQGYTFNGWFTEKNNGTGELVSGIELGSTGDITIYAQWGLESYAITYHNMNGATNTNAESYNIETETFTIENVSKIGYRFDGWFSNEALTIPADTTIEKGSYGELNFYAKWTLVGYSITYVLYGETTDDTTNPDGYTIEDAFMLKSPSRDGYIFVGWYTLAENGTRVTEIKANTTGNKTFYARWLKFESNGGSTVSYVPTHSGNYISSPAAPTKTHYAFAGWYTDVALTQKYNFAPTKSITLYAKWTPVNYTIEYVLGGGKNSTQNPSTYTVEDKVELYAASKTGYTFVGWFTDPEFTSTVVTEIAKGTSGKITLYAHYLINQYTISFESNGGTTVADITQNFATEVTAPEAPAKNGYAFAGWYTNSSLTSKYTFTTMPAENITLYAKWNIVTYDITYNLDGGTNNGSNPSSYKITSADITLKAPTKSGYTFDGWYTDSACTQVVTKIASGSYGDVELFANWMPITYTVTYDTPDGATHSNITSFTAETDLYTLKAATLKGYTFGGWYSDSTYTKPVTSIAGGSLGNVTLYAKFTANTYNVWLEGEEEAKHTVSFDLNGAQGSVASQTVTPSATLKYPTAPERSGYIFGGWYANADCTGEPYDFTAVVTKDIMLYAKWIKIENAALITINGNANVTLNGKTEQMLIFVPLVSGNVTITASGDFDTFGTLYNSSMTALVHNDDGASDGKNFHIVYNVTAGETYYIGARAFSSTTTGAATVSISGDTTILDGGYAITTSQTVVTYGKQFTLTLPEARDGYKFLGYADENGTMYTDENGNSVKAWDKDEDTILYSAWEIAVYTVTLKTDASTVFDEIELPYGARLDLSQYKPTMDGRVFVGWMYEGAAYNATTMPDHNITLTAQFSNYTLSLKVDEGKTAVSVNDAVDGKLLASLFNASAIENVTGGILPMEFECTVSGTIAAGETITVIIQNTENKLRKTITGIKVYGMPTLTFDDTVDYVNVNGGMTASHFGASGKDTFGVSTKINVYIDGEYEVGTPVKIVIESIDPAGNITYGYIENVKAYGKPVITYKESKAEISVNDTLNAELFDATAADSFGESLTVTVSRYSGTIAAGNTVTIRISATDSKGNVTNIDVKCKVYGAPTISEATKTDVRAEDDIVTPELLGITAKDTYGNPLTVTLTTKDGSQTAGVVWTVTATVTDAAGNVTTKDFELKVYGAPTISYDREGVKVTEDATTNPATILNAIATDSFGNPLTVTATVKSGSLTAGTYIVYNLTATDRLGNSYTLTTAPIGVYDVNDIDFIYSPTLSTIIKETSKGEEFNASATDSFGNACDITIEAAEGYTLEGGKTVSIYIIATDKAGNRVVGALNSNGDPIPNIKVYGVPIVTLSQNNRVITESTDVNFLFTVHDSFGEELYADVTVSGEQTTGNTIVVTVTATDAANNTVTKQYIFGVLHSEKPFVELYIDGELWQAIFIDDAADYVLPMPELADSFESLWFDKDYNVYSQTNGIGLIELPENIQLYYGAYKSGYSPIYTIKQLKAISLNNANVKYSLAIDLDLNGSEWTPIGTYGSPFTGIFDGNGHVISNFKITGSVQYAGLFGYNKGAIENLGVENFTIDVDVTSSSSYSYSYAGGLVGYNDEGAITNCYATGDVISSSSSSGSSSSYAGGLVGYNASSTITNCYATGDVTSSSSSSSSYRDSSSYAGGLVGYNASGTITNCYATGDVTSSSSSSSSYSDSDISSESYVGGLVGYNDDGTITNCYATGDVTSSSSSSYGKSSSYNDNYSYAGGLVGYNNGGGTITNSYAMGDVSSSSSSSYGKSYSYSNAGGLVGGNSGTIMNCYATGDVTSSSSYSSSSSYNDNYSYAGGLVGYNYGKITNCYATGDVSSSSSSSNSSSYSYDTYSENNSYAGGLVGCNNDNNGVTITNCYATGDVISSSSSSGYRNSYAGGLVGYNNYGTITNCYATGDVSSSSGYSHAGGLVGYNNDNNGATITNCYRYSGQSFTVTNETTTYKANNTLGTVTSIENLQSKEWVENNLWKLEIEIWNFGSGYPTLDYQTINTIVEISTKEDLLKLQGQCLTLKYRLAADIDLGGIEWTPITVFAGAFDGNGHVISNFKITGAVQYAGLFGYNIGTIENLGVENFTIDVSSSYSYSYAGGLVGYNYGKITNCYATGDVSSSSSSSSGYRNSYAGGLVGYNYGTITNCYATGDVISSSSISSYAGGLVGVNSGTITNSYATGDVTSSSGYSYAGGLVGYNNDDGTITNCYATGAVTSSECAGGLVGYNNDGTITNCYATGDVSSSSSSSDSTSYAGGLVGYDRYGTITNCYATGDVSSSSSYSDSTSYAGGLVGYNNGNTITNCYRYSGQSFTVTKSGTTTYSATNTKGTTKKLSGLQSVTFQTETLTWSADDWNFVEGQHPTLK